MDDVADADPGDRTRGATPGDLTKIGGEPIVDAALGDLDSHVTGDSLEGHAVENTQPRVRPDKPMPPGGALVNLATGDRVPLHEAPFLVGRGTHCQLQFEEEPTVSRAHLFLTYLDREGRWVVEDAGSTSGTVLNGKWLSAPTKLKHGDLIDIGTISLRYRMDPTVPAKAAIVSTLTGGEDREPTAIDAKTAVSRLAALDDGKKGKKGKKDKAKKDKTKKAKDKDKGPKKPLPWVAIAAGFALLLLVVGGGVGGYVIYRMNQAPEVLLAQKRTLLDEAQALLKALQLDDAKARIDAVFALDPDDEEAQSLLRIWESEVEAKAVLARAEALYKKGDVAGAKDELGKIPDSSGFAPARDALLRKFVTDLDDKLLADVAALLDLGELDEARKKLKALLKRDPKNEKALALLARLEEIASRPAPKNPALERARKAFAVGNVKQARVVAAAEAARGTGKAQAYVESVDRFTAAYDEGQRQLGRKNAGPAESQLAEAYRLARVLSGSKGRTYLRKVGAHYADALYLSAMIDKARGAGCGWGRRILQASALDPADSKIKAQRRKVDDTAQAALERAKARQDQKPAEAKRIAQDNACYARSSSKVGKALARLAR